jgi:hypothetical protein
VEEEVDDEVYFAKLWNLKPHSDNLTQLCKIEKQLGKYWNELEAKSILLKDCNNERDELERERQLYVKRLEVIDEDLKKVKAAQEELRCDALQEVQFIENMYTTQYTPLLSTVNEQQSVFGLDELERTSAMKDSDIASLKRSLLEPQLGKEMTSDPMQPSASTSFAHTSTSLSARHKKRSSSQDDSPSVMKRKRVPSKKEPTPGFQPSTAVPPRGTHKAGPSHKHCPHCENIIARNAVCCKWCFQHVSRKL